MLNRLTGAVLSLALISAPPVWAAPCKDARTGKFIKCPEGPKKVVWYKDAKGKSAKCGTRGAKSV